MGPVEQPVKQVLPQIMGVKELIQFLMHVVPDALLHLHLPEADMEEHQDKQEPTEDREEAAEKAQLADQEIHLRYHLLKEIQVEVFHQAE